MNWKVACDKSNEDLAGRPTKDKVRNGSKKRWSLGVANDLMPAWSRNPILSRLRTFRGENGARDGKEEVEALHLSKYLHAG
jgi:hypothetical protein